MGNRSGPAAFGIDWRRDARAILTTDGCHWMPGCPCLNFSSHRLPLGYLLPVRRKSRAQRRAPAWQPQEQAQPWQQPQGRSREDGTRCSPYVRVRTPICTGRCQACSGSAIPRRWTCLSPGRGSSRGVRRIPRPSVGIGCCGEGSNCRRYTAAKRRDRGRPNLLESVARTLELSDRLALQLGSDAIKHAADTIDITVAIRFGECAQNRYGTSIERLSGEILTRKISLSANENRSCGFPKLSERYCGHSIPSCLAHSRTAPTFFFIYQTYSATVPQKRCS